LSDAQQSSSEKCIARLVYMKGVRRRGRQPKRWTDNITEWTGLSVSDAVDKTQDRKQWKKFVVSRSHAVQPHETTREREREREYRGNRGNTTWMEQR